MEPEKRTSSVKVLDGNVFVSFHLLHLGKGTMFTASFLRSAFNWPGNLENFCFVILFNFGQQNKKMVQLTREPRRGDGGKTTIDCDRRKHVFFLI